MMDKMIADDEAHQATVLERQRVAFRELHGGSLANALLAAGEMWDSATSKRRDAVVTELNRRTWVAVMNAGGRRKAAASVVLEEADVEYFKAHGLRLMRQELGIVDGDDTKIRWSVKVTNDGGIGGSGWTSLEVAVSRLE